MFQPGAALYFVWITCKLTSEVDETIIEKKLEPSSRRKVDEMNEKQTLQLQYYA